MTETNVSIDSSWLLAINEVLKTANEWGTLAVSLVFIGILLTRESRHTKDTKNMYDSLFSKFETNLETNNKLVSALDNNTEAIKEMLIINSSKLDSIKDMSVKSQTHLEIIYSDVKDILRYANIRRSPRMNNEIKDN